MPILSWRCHQTTSTPGTGPLALNAPSTDRRGFQQTFGNAARRVPYVIQGAGFYELGFGDFDGGFPGALQRAVVMASSNGGNLVDLPVGASDVFAWIDPSQRGVVTGSGTMALGVIDAGNAMVWTGSNAATMSLPAIGAMPEGLGYLVRNAGTAMLVIDPAGTDPINGAQTLTLWPGQSAEILRVGAAWAAFGETTKFVGELFHFAGTTAPPRCLWAAGQAVSRSYYAALFAMIGTTYGGGDGGTTFNVPDCRGRALFGADTLGGIAAGRLTPGGWGVNAVLGAAGGSEFLQSHSHGVNEDPHSHGASTSPHDHGTDATHPFNVGGGGYGNGGGQNISFTGAVVYPQTVSVSIASASIDLTIQAAGGGGSQNMPPAVICNIALYAGI